MHCVRLHAIIPGRGVPRIFRAWDRIGFLSCTMPSLPRQFPPVPLRRSRAFLAVLAGLAIFFAASGVVGNVAAVPSPCHGCHELESSDSDRGAPTAWPSQLPSEDRPLSQASLLEGSARITLFPDKADSTTGSSRNSASRRPRCAFHRSGKWLRFSSHRSLQSLLCRWRA